MSHYSLVVVKEALADMEATDWVATTPYEGTIIIHANRRGIKALFMIVGADFGEHEDEKCFVFVATTDSPHWKTNLENPLSWILLLETMDLFRQTGTFGISLSYPS
jgi:hypothetical protein